MPEIIDDKSEHCIPFIIERLKAHEQRYPAPAEAPPFFIGLNGVQGAGKTVLVSTIQKTLRNAPYNLPNVVLSADDIYLTHADQVALAESNPKNPLLQHRGQPSTHDLALGLSVFESLRRLEPTKIPQYNKAAFNGQGDRVPESQWEQVNGPGQEKIKVVLFEGWCVAFRPLDDASLKAKWREAVEKKDSGHYSGRLGYNRLEDVAAINEALKSYDKLTDQLNALVHIDAEDLQFVYKWRLQQEEGLRASKGSGMTDDQVKHFVDGYYPSYELFTETLQAGVFKDPGRQLRLIVGEDRRVKNVIRI